MADDVRLYMFECGSLKTQTQFIKMNQGMGEEYTVPVPWFFIQHPKGNVVIDGGNAAEVAADADKHWGDVAQVYVPQMEEKQACVPALEEAGLDPSSVKYILQSHLHLDHSGAVAAADQFPNAKVVVTRTEYDYAHAPDWFCSAGYIQADFNKDGVDWMLLDESDDGYDLFGDGVIRMYRTPGHAIGHQSFEVTLPQSGSMLLTADAAYTVDHWNSQALPGLIVSALDVVHSVQKLHRIAERSESTVVTGHDPEAWPQFKQAPEFYD